MTGNGTRAAKDAIEEELGRILASKVFASAQRSREFLRYVVERSLMDPPPAVKEFSIAVDVFGGALTTIRRLTRQ